jgi:SAM-dependent MidA family methyltransferase
MDILTNCGEADITTHVNFSHVQEILKTENTSIVPLATFLIGLGLPVRAADLIEKQPAKTEEIEHAVYRLLHAEQMGGLFKVLTKIYIND